MENTIREALEKKKAGFHIGHRLVLPFKCQLLKVIVENSIYTEMVGGKNVKINQDPQNTSIYFRTTGDLNNYVDTFKVIKLIVCEMNDDITDMSTHVKLVCEIKDNHLVDIHAPSPDMLFIE